jgi:hypothetical protein
MFAVACGAVVTLDSGVSGRLSNIYQKSQDTRGMVLYIRALISPPWSGSGRWLSLRAPSRP